MKAKTLFTTIIIGAVCQFAPQTSRAQDIDSIAPVVVKTVPEAGSKDVAPGEMEIKVTFSKEMMDDSWSWSTAWEDSTPEIIGKPHYEADHKTCVLKVKLEPNRTYGWWINSQNFHGFRDTQNHPAVPYLLVFQTRAN
jgi:Bacterial Ig-like domain